MITGHNSKQKCNLATKDGYLSLNTIYGISDNDDDIINVNKTYNDQIPNSVVIVAESDSGNQICIEKSTGKILFWSHEGTPNVDELFNVASSFDQFIKKLEVDDDGDLNDPDLDDIECSLDF